MDGLYNESGRISNKNQAEELAYLEKPARDREAELKRQSETGLSDFERNNIEIIDGLEKKYPLAFDSRVDDKGRKVMTLGVFGENDETWGLGGRLWFTQQGIITHSGRDFDADYVNLTNLNDMMERHGYQEPSKDVLCFDAEDVLKPELRERYNSDEVTFFRIDLTNERIIKNMGILLQKRQEFVAGRKKEEEQKQAHLDPQAILAKL